MVFGVHVSIGEEVRSRARRRLGLPLAAPALSWGRCQTRLGITCHWAALVSTLHPTSQHEHPHVVHSCELLDLQMQDAVL